MEVQRLNHWTAREVLALLFLSGEGRSLHSPRPFKGPFLIPRPDLLPSCPRGLRAHRPHFWAFFSCLLTCVSPRVAPAPWHQTACGVADEGISVPHHPSLVFGCQAIPWAPPHPHPQPGCMVSPDGPPFPFLLGHAQSRSMNDISLTPNTDQVGNPCPWLQRRARAERSLWF